MHFAAILERYPELKAMLDKGGNPFLRNNQGQTVESILRSTTDQDSRLVEEIFNNIDLLKRRTPQETNESLVHSAVRRNNFKKLRFYHRLGASLDTYNLKGKTPRDLAVELGLYPERSSLIMATKMKQVTRAGYNVNSMKQN